MMLPRAERKYEKKVAEFAYTIFWLCLLVLAISIVPGKQNLMGTQFIMAMVYIYSKKEENSIPLFGIHVKALYLPYALAIIHILSGNEIISDIIGILAGHIFYFVKDLCPVKYGIDILKTPGFL